MKKFEFNKPFFMALDVYKRQVENAMDFSDQYGDGIGFSVYLPLETETAQREVTVYRNGQMVAVSGITLTQGGTCLLYTSPGWGAAADLRHRRGNRPV